MKNLVESLFNKKDTLDKDVHKYHPHNKVELIDCIEKELKLQGPDANLNCIDVSKIADMNWLFWDLNDLDIRNIDISKWDVSNVNNMDFMFYKCKNFDSDLSRWDVSKVEDMDFMFCNCKKFNSDISRWDVSKVKTMNSMFEGCTSLKKIPDWYK